MPSILGRLAVASVVGLAVLAATPAFAVDIDIDETWVEPVPVAPAAPAYVPQPPPAPPVFAFPQAMTYDYMTNGHFRRLVAVRIAPTDRSQVLYGLPTGMVPNLTGRCTHNLQLEKIADHSHLLRSVFIKSRWCEVAGIGGAPSGWVRGSNLKPF